MTSIITFMDLQGLNESHTHAHTHKVLTKSLQSFFSILFWNGQSGTPTRGDTWEEHKNKASYIHRS